MRTASRLGGIPYVTTSLDPTRPARVISFAMPSPRARLATPLMLLAVVLLSFPASAAPAAAESFAHSIRPLLEKHCYACHGEGAHKGNVAFDQYDTDDALVRDTQLWLRVLKNVRGGLMPPPKKPQPSDAEKSALADWIKYGAFGLDPAHPDPGRVTLRRLNRVEYRNTVRDLMGVDFRADEEFPPDDTGHGFDNLGDVLTVSPMLLEKYLGAAQAVVSQAVPVVPKVVPERVIPGGRFHPVDAPAASFKGKDASLNLSYYSPASVAYTANIDHPGVYHLVVELQIKGYYAEKGFDYNRCEVAFGADGKELFRKQYGWSGSESLRFEFDQTWQPGDHHFGFALAPLTSDPNRYGQLEMRLMAVKIAGPVDDERLWVRPKNYERFFGNPEAASVPALNPADRARAILRPFATRAFRRPVDDATVDRLVALAASVYEAPKKTFEAGVAHAMVAVLASPRFLFREEQTLPLAPGDVHPLIDGYALATRLSYFLWSTMPDDELTRLAAAGQLRKNLPAQVKRMLADPRAEALVSNFTGQWLQARDVEGIVIESRRTTDRETLRRVKLVTDRDTRETRVAMHQEIERYFAYVAREDRSVLELVDSDYAFVNERLANYYGIPNVTGDDVRRVPLPEGSPRGGLLTAGGVLLVTSNPTRTSPVKRGLFVLENILGTPTPPPPPDIPPLEDAGKKFKDRTPTLRETLELHRASPVCMSCHDRMDPLGLAFENFNALGIWREKDGAQPIDPKGVLISGESFADVRALKKILVSQHRNEFYRCLTEKLMTYALGRGVEYYDTESVDRIVEALEKSDGRFSALLTGVIDSAPFQQRRATNAVAESDARTPARQAGKKDAKP